MTTRASRTETDIQRLEALGDVIRLAVAHQDRRPHDSELADAVDEYLAAFTAERTVLLMQCRKRRDRKRLLQVIDGEGEGAPDALAVGGLVVAGHHLPAAATAGIVAAASVAGAAIYASPPDVTDMPHPSVSAARPSRRSSTAPSLPGPRVAPTPRHTHTPPVLPTPPKATTAPSASSMAPASPAAGTVVTAVPTDTPTLPEPPNLGTVSPSPPDQHRTCMTLSVLILRAHVCLPHDGGLEARAG